MNHAVQDTENKAARRIAMKNEDIRNMELSDDQLDKAAGGFYIGPYERTEIDGETYIGCPSCGEARKVGGGPCPVCGAK